MTEVWSGTIDARLDALRASGQSGARYVLSGVGHVVEPAAVADDDVDSDEQNFKERIVIRDRDCLPLPHVGLWVHVVLARAPAARGAVRTYTVVRLLGARPLARLGTTVFTRALCNGIVQCRARAERLAARADGRSLAGLRDTPLAAVDAKYATALGERPTGEMALLLRDDAPTRCAAAFLGIHNYFLARSVFAERALGRLLALLTAHPLAVAASAVVGCSLAQLESLVAHVEQVDPLSTLFGGAGASPLAQFVCASLAETPALAPAPAVGGLLALCQTGTCVPQALWPLDDALRCTPAEFRRPTTNAQHARDLLRQAARHMPSATNDTLDRAAAAHAAVDTQMRYGRTVFAHTTAPDLEALGVWQRVRTSRYAQTTGRDEYTTPQCASRARQLAALLAAAFTSVTVFTVDGDCALLDSAELDAAFGDRRAALIVAPSDASAAEVGAPFALADLLAGTDWALRAAASVADTLVLCDAHRLGDVDLLHALLAFQRLATLGRCASPEPWSECRLVLVGDPRQQPAGRCAGSPLADLVASAKFAVDVLAAPARPDARRHRLAALAAGACESALCAEVLVDELLRVRCRESAAILDALRESRQLVVWVSSSAMLGAYMASLCDLLRAARKRSAAAADDDDDDDPRRRFDADALQAFERLRDHPHVARSNIAAVAPFLLYDGVAMRAEAFYQIVSWPARGAPLGIEKHCRRLLPENGLVSLDATNLMLRVDTPTVDHRMCCGTADAHLIRVACHRRQMRAASVLRGAEAAHATLLASRVAVGLLHAASRDGPMMGAVRWNETALGLVRLPADASLRLLAHTSVGTADAIGAALVGAMVRARTKPPTALDHELERL